MTLPSFAELGVSEPIRAALTAQGYSASTPIQARAIPILLAGKDLLGIAQTGSGKTAAFAVPILQRLSERREPAGARATHALILAPTRELAIQIADDCRTYGRNVGLRIAVIYGGVGQNPQVQAMARGVDILIATPGRLLDLIEQGHVRLDRARTFVLDEADRMMDMGFIRDVRRIVAKLPRDRQSLLFSATMPTDIARLAGEMLSSPERVDLAPTGVAVERIEQRVIHVAAADKRRLLADLLRDPGMTRVIVFTRTKHGANRVAEHLDRAKVAADAIHGNKSQSARQRALDGFRAGHVRVLVATDIASRGIDVDDISHVVNFDIPNVPEDYVHRIGRTARAGSGGAAIALCDPAERPFLKAIEKLTRKTLAVATHALPAAGPADRTPDEPRRRNAGRNGTRHGRGRNQRSSPAPRREPDRDAYRSQQPR
ncbi:MAG: DEAD/DEAH box helicase [Alphaproteobacteria bacterium]|nr:DEAD/DEAH box helicase [Alphaproteobacteria bacterium]